MIQQVEQKKQNSWLAVKNQNDQSNKDENKLKPKIQYDTVSTILSVELIQDI